MAVGTVYTEARLTWRAGVDSAFPKKDSGKRSDSLATVTSAYSDIEQVIGTSPEVLDITALVATPGQMMIINLDSTNFITYGPQGNLCFKLKAGEHCYFRAVRGQTYYAQADTANVRVRFVAIVI